MLPSLLALFLNGLALEVAREDIRLLALKSHSLVLKTLDLCLDCFGVSGLHQATVPRLLFSLIAAQRAHSTRRFFNTVAPPWSVGMMC